MYSLRPERSPFLKKLGQMLLRQAREQGAAVLCDNLSLPEYVLKVLNGEVLVQPPLKRPRSPSPPVYQDDLRGDIMRPDLRPDLLEPLDSDSQSYFAPGPLQQVQNKVKTLYDMGVDIRIIQALYGIPPVLVHSWGDFKRSKKAEKLRRLRRILTEKMSNGEELTDAVKGLRMTKLHAEHILGMCEEMAAARNFSEDHRFEVIEEARRAPRPGNVARKYGIPKATLHRWLRGDFTHNDGDSAFVQSDEWGLAAHKRKCLEAFYLNKRDASRTALSVSMSEDKVLHVVEDFETRVSTRAGKDFEDPQF